MSQKKPTVDDSRLVAKTQVFAVEAVDLTFSNGESRCYERLVGKPMGSVLVLAVADQQQVLLIREYGAGVDGYTLGFPKGLVDPGETPLEAADRELKEETGYGARQVSFMTELSVSPNYMMATTAVIVASDLYPCRLSGDEPEPMEVIPWSLNEIDSLLKHPEFVDSRNIAALLMYCRGGHDGIG